MSLSVATTGFGLSRKTRFHFGATVVFDAEAGEGHGPEGGRGVARVPDDQIEIVVEAAEECPGECIMIEAYSAEAIANRGA